MSRRMKGAARERHVPPLPRITVDLTGDSPVEQFEKFRQIAETNSLLNRWSWRLERYERAAALGDLSEVPALEDLRKELRYFRIGSKGKLIDEAAGASLLRIGMLAVLCGYEDDAIAGRNYHRRLAALRPSASVRRAANHDEWVKHVREIAPSIWKTHPKHSANAVARILIKRLQLKKSVPTVCKEIADLKPEPEEDFG